MVELQVACTRKISIGGTCGNSSSRLAAAPLGVGLVGTSTENDKSQYDDHGLSIPRASILILRSHSTVMWWLIQFNVCIIPLQHIRSLVPSSEKSCASSSYIQSSPTLKAFTRIGLHSSLNYHLPLSIRPGVIGPQAGLPPHYFRRKANGTCFLGYPCGLMSLEYQSEILPLRLYT